MKNIESIVNHLTQIDPQIILIGCSSGGLDALEKVLEKLPKAFPLPIVICQHLAPDAGEYLVKYFDKHTNLPIFEAKSDQNIAAGYIYFAPGGYHLLIEENRSFSLDVSERVSYCRPSIDVLFDSAITVYKAHILAIILSGANEDGAMGATHIIKHKGIVIVQDPATAQNSVMPQAVIAHEAYNYILSPVEMNIVLKRWSDGK